MALYRPMTAEPEEPGKAVIEVFFEDGNSKSFLVTAAQTSNAVKYKVSQDLGLDQVEWPTFGLFVLDGDKIGPLEDEHPYNIRIKWDSDKSGATKKFLFKKNLTKEEREIELKSAGAWLERDIVRLVSFVKVTGRRKIKRRKKGLLPV